ncbi:acetate--CoA ligase family protein [Neobacillus niacini]|uniref:acetate--CoA ligase family protein n=1 Tax=Neobacillus niacini TaxID=86668 RepID=UPI003B026861
MNKEAIKEILALIRERNSLVIPESYSKKIFEHLGMGIPKQGLAKSEEEAIFLAQEIGFPVVLKVHSFEITHKSDAKGVLVGVKTPNEVRAGFREIMSNASDYLGTNTEIQVSVQQMIESGTEIIIGMKRDEIFGPTILFGLGGVWVEVLKDVSIRVAPLTERDVDEMISEIKGKRLLGEFRGAKARDRKALKSLLFQVERLALEFPEISEIDLNPVFLHEEGKGAMVVDARIILSSESLISEGAV